MNSLILLSYCFNTTTGVLLQGRFWPSVTTNVDRLLNKETKPIQSSSNTFIPLYLIKLNFQHWWIYTFIHHILETTLWYRYVERFTTWRIKLKFRYFLATSSDITKSTMYSIILISTTVQKTKVQSANDWLINSNGMSPRLGLFYPCRWRNRDHYTIMFTFLVPSKVSFWTVIL